MRNSVSFKLFITFFLSILCFVLIVGIASYQMSKRVIKTEVSEASEQTIIQLSDKLDNLYASLEDLSAQMMVDQDFQYMLSEANKAHRRDYAFQQLVGEINNQRDAYEYANKQVHSIQLYSIEGKPLASTHGELLHEDYSTEPWFQSIVEANSQPVWLETLPTGYSNSGASFALGRALRNTTANSTEITAIALIEVSTEVFTEQFERVQLGDEAQVYIINDSKKVIFNEQSEALDPVYMQEAFGSIITDNEHMLNVYARSNVSGWYVVGQLPVEQLVESAGAIFKFTLIMAGGALVFAVGIGYFIVRLIGRPIVRISHLMKQGAEGDLSVRSRYRTADEIGQLGQSFDHLMGQFTNLVNMSNQTVQEVYETTQQLTSVSRATERSAYEVATATEAISKGAGNLAEEAERGNELRQQLEGRINEVIQVHSELDSYVDGVKLSSEQGAAYMKELTAKTTKAEAATLTMMQKVNQLQTNTQSIRNILDMLTEMAKHTHILSLNATIEAARAGSAAGKGFSVVADEIRQLADQSKQSIEIVDDIIDRIHLDMHETVVLLREAGPIYKAQIDAVVETDTLFKDVYTNMNQFIEQLLQANTYVEEMGTAQIVLAETMVNSSAISEEFLATAEEVTSVSSQQHGVSKNIVELSNKLNTFASALKDTLNAYKV